MEQLRHDPLTKRQIKDAILDYVYKPFLDDIDVKLEALVSRNTVLGQYRHRSVVHKGILYNYEASPPPIRQNQLLLPQLREEFEALVKERDEVLNHEQPLVGGYISGVLNSTNNVYDYLRLFPESIHRPIKKLIETCPCQHSSLSQARIDEILKKNNKGLLMLKQRLVRNLLL